MKTTGVQKSGYHKAWVSAGIFLTTVIVGGLAIFAATNLDDLKAGANGNMLTATGWDTLIDHVKNHDLIIGEGLSKLDTDILRVEGKVDGLSGFGQQGNEIGLQLSGLMSHVSGINIQTTNMLAMFEGSESGVALKAEIINIGELVQNQVITSQTIYEKLKEQIENLEYRISLISCEGNSESNNTFEETPIVIDTNVQGYTVKVVVCQGLNCENYSMKKTYSSDTIQTKVYKDKGIVVVDSSHDMYILSCQGTECKSYSMKNTYSTDKLQVISSEGTIAVVVDSSYNTYILSCQGTECKSYSMKNTYSTDKLQVISSEGTIAVVVDSSYDTYILSCQGTECKSYSMKNTHSTDKLQVVVENTIIKINKQNGKMAMCQGTQCHIY